MSEQDVEDGVDRSPIDQLQRRNSLGKHLQSRPNEQDLKHRHILLDTTAAPALQARQAELERQRITDNLKKGLGKRPEKGDLVEKNILSDSTAAPSLQQAQRELAKHMRADSIEKHLQARPRQETLVKEGILHGEYPVLSGRPYSALTATQRTKLRSQRAEG
ncbi:hypothetical protein LTR17_024105 [Elasticomyces elasticus]|nr:hypothetical protein LTR17_024105 [Elasticomyces elasticus]